MTLKTVRVDVDQMVAGTFYTMQTNKDNATAIFPVKNVNTDFSGFNKILSGRKVVLFTFTNKEKVEIPIVMPTDSYASILAIHKKTAEGNLRPVNNYDYIYDNTLKVFKFDFDGIINGQILMEFYV